MASIRNRARLAALSRSIHKLDLSLGTIDHKAERLYDDPNINKRQVTTQLYKELNNGSFEYEYGEQLYDSEELQVDSRHFY